MTLNRHRAARVGAVGLALALVAGACGGGGDSESTSEAGAEAGKKGGTLTFLDLSDYEHIDPQRNYVGSTLNFARLFTRTLVTYKAVPGPEGTSIVPDLATDLGTASDGNKSWSWTLKDNVKWEDGSPITCGDIKYGVERSFSDLITGGPQYAQQYLEGVEGYKGPYVGGNNGGKGLESIVCDGDKKITFKLNKAVGDFNYTTTLGQFAPVKAEKDTKEKYDNNVFSSGPYKIQTYTREKEMVLVRNENWDPKTDEVRKALPDTIRAEFGLEANVIAQRLIADAPEDQTAVMNSVAVPPENIQQVLSDPALKERSISGLSGFVRYIAINTKKIPDVNCRKALIYAMNRETYRGVLGGESFGDYATTTITPAIKSYKDFDVYGLKDKPSGDVAKAKEALAAGNNCPTTLKYDFSNTETQQKVAAAVSAAFSRIGVKITPNPIERAQYYDTIGKTATQGDLSIAGWGPDWPNGSSVIPPLFDGRQIRPEGNQIFSQLNDPELNTLIDAANNETDLDKQATLWGELDQKVQEKAAIIPLIYDKIVQLRGSKVGGAYLAASYGYFDAVSLSAA